MLKVIIITAALFAAIVCVSCNDKPNVQQEYGFRLECWHLPDDMSPEGDVEMRFTLVRGGDYAQASYNLGYIQLDRTDRLRQVFTLYYRSKTDKAAWLRFFIKDNFGKQRILDIELQGIARNQQSPK